MKKEELKSDLIVCEKLEDETFRLNVSKAYQIFKGLNVSNKIEYYLYCFHFEEFEKVSFEEVKSFSRLHNTEYLYSIKKLKEQLSKKDKVIEFPNLF